jgi:hypothetical protein
MTEFLNLTSVQPQLTDEVLLVRDRVPKRSTVASLVTAGPQGPQGVPGADGPQGLTGPTTLHLGATPSTDPTKLLWGQLGTAGEFIELWQKHSTGQWLSAQTFLVSSHTVNVASNAVTNNANPCPSSQIFVEQWQATGVVADAMTAANFIDFKLSLVNQLQVETSFFSLRLQGAAAANTPFSLAESVNQFISSASALSLWFRSARSGSMSMRYLTMSTTLRKVYAP